ncbi:MAG: type II toxin-antitoxin system HicA family toxin [Methanospirillaceae archaeon]|nr:type II toxin-antitoxin system HicA family toxin [Methanospirillaceae archaeon]
MTRLPPLKTTQILSILKDAGYVCDRKKGSHQISYHPDTGRRVVVPIHPGREIPSGTLHEILRQAGITREDVMKFLSS